MKRYWLFSGVDAWEPGGGWQDFASDFDTLSDAKGGITVDTEWAHVVDSETFDIVSVWRGITLGWGDTA